MDPEQRVFIERLIIDGANYWGVDRVRLEKPSWITNEAHHNVLNRVLVQKLEFDDERNDALYIRGDSHHNTIQNSVICNSPFDPGEDVEGIVLYGAPHTRIVCNEIFNMAGDAIISGAPTGSRGAIGTRIIDNDLYITPRMYSDGKGQLDREGHFAGAENAIDVKQASLRREHPIPPEKQMTIAFNRMWGFRETDNRIGGNGSNGATVVIHRSADSSFVRMHHNLFFDGPLAYAVVDNHHHTVTDNLFWDIGIALRPRRIEHLTYRRNILVDVNRWLHGSRKTGAPDRRT